MLLLVHAYLIVILPLILNDNQLRILRALKIPTMAVFVRVIVLVNILEALLGNRSGNNSETLAYTWLSNATRAI